MNDDAPATPPDPTQLPDASSARAESSPDAPVEATGLQEAGEREGTARDPLETLRQENAELRDALLRRRAEFENFRRRTERDRQSWSCEAEAALVQELIPTLDHLAQALSASASEGSLRDGVELIQRDLLATLARLGLSVHDPVGQPFDPLTDQALLHEEAPGITDGTVTETLRKGYLFKQRLLRPALVKVAKGVSGEAEPDPADTPSEMPAKEVH